MGKQDLETILMNKGAAMGMPVKATLELSPLCNLNCAMCYVRQSAASAQELGGVKPYTYWESLIPELKDMGVLIVALIGGEPFLYPGIERLYCALFEQGFLLNLTTNGTLLSEGVPEWIQKQSPRYVTVSLYGASDETYEAVTGDGTGFTRAMRGITNLLDAGIPVKLSYVAVPGNKQDAEKIFRISKQLNLPLVSSGYCFPNNRKDSECSCFQRLTPEECAKVELELLKWKEPDAYEDTYAYLARGEYKMQTAKHTRKMYCHGGSSTFWINWRGEMTPCGMITSIAETAEAGSLQYCWEQVRGRTEQVLLSGKCANCHKREICQVCPAMMEAEMGSLSGTPEYLCRVTEEKIRLCNS